MSLVIPWHGRSAPCEVLTVWWHRSSGHVGSQAQNTGRRRTITPNAEATFDTPNSLSEEDYLLPSGIWSDSLKDHYAVNSTWEGRII